MGQWSQTITHILSEPDTGLPEQQFTTARQPKACEQQGGDHWPFSVKV